MRFARKIWIKHLSLAIGFTLLIILPRLSLANVVNQASSDPKIVARDESSGVVIYQSNHIYYYGKQGSLAARREINPHRIIVKYKKESGIKSLSLIAATVSQYGATSQLSGALQLALLSLERPGEYFAALQALAGNPNVAYAEPDFIAHATGLPDDPYYAQQWGVRDIHAAPAWEKVAAEKRAAVTIAVVDTGVIPDHEDLQDNIVPGFNFVAEDANPGDDNGHGTHVAGIAAAIVNNGKGIAGIAGGSKIMPVKVLDENGSGDYVNIINGIQYATAHNAQVINLSLGGPAFSRAIADAVREALRHGVSVVAASGNDGGPISFPGGCDGVITVGAVDGANERAAFSNFGPKMDVVAPGVDILSSYKRSAASYATLSGTSMAAPFVTGVVALVRAANPGLAPAEVAGVIDRSATDLGAPGFDNEYGYGLVNAAQAVTIALQEQAGRPIPEPPADPVTAPTPDKER